MKDRFAIDTSVIFYALDRGSPKQEKAKNFMAGARNNEAAITVRSLAECYSLALKRSENPEKAGIFVESLKHDPEFDIISAGKRELDESLNVQSNFWDRLIETTALENGYEVIYTKNIDNFDQIEAINPLE